VDEHQALVAVGIGVVAGVAAVVLTGGVAAPLIVGALAAGAASALGTVGLNAYYDRPLGTNLLRNVGLSVIAGTLTSGVGLLVRSGLAVRAALGVGNAVGAWCMGNPVACSRAEVVMRTIDTVEELGLQAQLAFQTAVGDPGAGKTALELQLEYMEGGAPGNTAIRELSEDVAEIMATHGDEGAEFLARFGDDASELVETHGDHILNVFEHYGDEAVSLVGSQRDSPESAARLIGLLQDGSPAPEHWSSYVPPELHEDILEAFDGEPMPVVVGQDSGAFRYWSDPAAERGHWLTLDPHLSPEEARAALALPAANTASQMSPFTIREGTVVLVGRAASQTSALWAGSYALGGGLQVYVPDLASLLTPGGP
jgi:hypothetical protein